MWFIWKITIAAIMVTHTTQAANLICYAGSISNSKSLPLNELKDFGGTRYLPSGCKLGILIPGREDSMQPITVSLLATLIEHNDRCYCLLDLKSESTGSTGLLGGLIGDIGHVVGDVLSAITSVVNALLGGLKELKNIGVNLDNIQLIAISEGSVLAGHLAQKFQEIDVTVEIITALNPAKGSLQYGDAKLIVCLHTSSAYFSDQYHCDINFWINPGCNVQPGCSSDLCSAERAVSLFSEATKNPGCAPGRKALNTHGFKELCGIPNYDEVNYFGPNLKQSFHGDFFLCTNSRPPFGKGLQGCNPSNCECL